MTNQKNNEITAKSTKQSEIAPLSEEQQQQLLAEFNSLSQEEKDFFQLSKEEFEKKYGKSWNTVFDLKSGRGCTLDF